MTNDELKIRAQEILERGALSFTWTKEALCTRLPASRDEFFPDPGRIASDVRMICAACPVRAECLVEAILNDEKWGIWGGLSRNERRSWADLMGVPA